MEKEYIPIPEFENYGITVDEANGHSYVLVIKEDANKYSYHTCLICNKDGYDNTVKDMYCDETWLDSTKVKYGPNLFKYCLYISFIILKIFKCSYCIV